MTTKSRPARRPAAGQAIIEARIKEARGRLAVHPVYARLNSLKDVRVFMQHHIFAVWDFMSLLKALQRELTCVDVPWKPVGQARTRRFINAIVLEEETDEVDGQVFSHFELYRQAMIEIGADTGPCDRFLAAVSRRSDIPGALKAHNVPPAAAAFVKSTFRFIATGQPHIIAAAFTFGREEPIPAMFRALLATLVQQGAKVSTLNLYLERHIHLDEQDHGPMAAAMLSDLCGQDSGKWHEAAEAAAGAIEARLAFWDGVLAALDDPRSGSIAAAAAGR